MFSVKKTAAAVLILSGSVACAGTMGPVCTPGTVTVPCEGTAWEIGGYALYLQAAQTGPFAYLGLTNGAYNKVNSGWDWSFALEATYHYATGSDISINWDHVTFNADHLVSSLDNRHYESEWNAVDVELGQTVDLSATNKIRLHSGIQYARVNASINRGLEYTGYNSDFNGFGPRVGLDMNYGLAKGFGVYLKGATALLAGTSSFADLVTVGTLSGSRTVVVPEFEAKLGANYVYAMAQSDLIFDAGYMWFDYLNVHHNTATTAGVVHDGSFAASGPYVGLKLIGNV
jgi:hypothetical protein